MTCTRNFDDFDTTTTTYDAFGNVVSEEEQRVLRADGPVILSPPGTSEHHGGEFSLKATKVEACESNLFRFHVPGQAGDNEAEVFQYNRARRFDPTVGRWLAEEPLGFQAGDDNLYPYPRQEVDPNS